MLQLTPPADDGQWQRETSARRRAHELAGSGRYIGFDGRAQPRGSGRVFRLALKRAYAQGLVQSGRLRRGLRLGL